MEAISIIETTGEDLPQQIENIIANSDSGEIISIKLIDGEQSQVYAISKGIDTEPPICNNSNN